MARAMYRLTKLAVDRARPGLHADGGGLYLVVGKTGSRSWLFRFERGGKNRWHGLGSVLAVSLADARVAAQSCREHLAAGRDPIRERRAKIGAARAAANVLTFRACVTAYIADHEAGWINPKTRSKWLSTMETYVYREIGDLPVVAVETDHVKRILKPIWAKKNPTAKGVRQRIEQVLSWAFASGYRSDPLNPARWDGLLEHSFPAPRKVHRETPLRALPYAELSGFMTKLQKREGVPARCLEWVTLSALRATAGRGARWTEIDEAEGIWTVPDNHIRQGTKLKKSLRVPITDRMFEILELQRDMDDELIFPGAKKGKPFGHDAMRDLLFDMGYGDLATTHGMRSCFRTWAAEETAFPREIVEMAIGHAIDDLEGRYQRGALLAKRHKLMTAWANYLIAPAEPSSNVAQFRKAAR